MAHDTKEFLQALLDGGTQYICRIYRVVRLDGVTLRFTDHDNLLQFREGWLDGGDAFAAEETYSPMQGWNGSAARAESAMKVANMEFAGAISASAITDADLHAGLWNGALIDVAWIDWRFPWAGAFRHHHYRLTDFDYSEESWTAQASNLMTELQRRFGKRYNKTCWKAFMSDSCGIAVAAGVTHFKCVVLYSPNTENREFLADDVPGLYAGMRNQSTHYFRAGHLKWTSGNNIGQIYPIAAHRTTDERVTLQYPCRATIQIGDAFDIWAGCDRRYETCASATLGGGVDNHLRFGGFSEIPGTSQVAKAGLMTV